MGTNTELRHELIKVTRAVELVTADTLKNGAQPVDNEVEKSKSKGNIALSRLRSSFTLTRAVVLSSGVTIDVAHVRGGG